MAGIGSPVPVSGGAKPLGARLAAIRQRASTAHEEVRDASG